MATSHAASLRAPRRLHTARNGLKLHEDEAYITTRRMHVSKLKKSSGPDEIRTRNLLIWSQTHYHCATEPLPCGKGCKLFVFFSTRAASRRIGFFDQCDFKWILGNMLPSCLGSDLPPPFVWLSPRLHPVFDQIEPYAFLIGVADENRKPASDWPRLFC